MSRLTRGITQEGRLGIRTSLSKACGTTCLVLAWSVETWTKICGEILGFVLNISLNHMGMWSNYVPKCIVVLLSLDM